MRPDRFRAYSPEGQLVLIDAVPANGPLRFATAAFVERVVLYAVADNVETVVGEVTVRHSGEITVDLPPAEV